MKEYSNLREFFNRNKKVALAFSGGVDSAYLLAEAAGCGVNIKAYFIKSRFQPDFELADARCLAEEFSVDFEVIEADVLSDKTICENPKNRCYYCKQKIFKTLIDAANRDGFDLIIDGTNASDEAGDRPGMKALEEMNVVSPLRLCGMRKDEIREKSKELGLFTWDKPSYACLATRIPQGTRINEEKLAKVEAAEDILKDMGFSDFRVRYFCGCAKIQVKENQMEKVFKNRTEIKEALSPYFESVFLDLEER